MINAGVRRRGPELELCRVGWKLERKSERRSLGLVPFGVESRESRVPPRDWLPRSPDECRADNLRLVVILYNLYSVLVLRYGYG